MLILAAQEKTMLPLRVIWNPLEGIDLGFLTLHFYSLSYVVAFTVGWYIMKPIFKRDGVPLERMDTLFIYTVVGCLLGARIGHYLFYEPDVLFSDPLHVLLPFQLDPFEWTGFRGLASHGAALGIIIAMYFFSRKIGKHMFWSLDRLVIPTAIGGSAVRLGNLINSEIVGDVTDVSWAFKFIKNPSDIRPSTVVNETGIRDLDKAYDALANDPQFAGLLETIPYRHPTQIYEAICYVGVFIALYLTYWKTDKRHKLGYLLGLFFVLLFTVRFFIEFVKVEQVAGGDEFIFGLNTGQMLSIPFVLVGLFLMFRPHNFLINDDKRN
jgi:prolipoprotein diacylglyceryl transferase